MISVADIRVIDKSGWSTAIGEWVQVRWNFDADQGKPHPEYESVLKAFNGHFIGRLETIDSEGWLSIVYFSEYEVKLEPFSLMVIPIPKYKIGDTLKVKDLKKHSAYSSAVSRFVWHHKDGAYYYQLEGKSKKYAESDLEGSG